MLKEAVSKIPEEDSNILRDEPKNAFKLEELASSLCEETGVKGEDLKPQSIAHEQWIRQIHQKPYQMHLQKVGVRHRREDLPTKVRVPIPVKISMNKGKTTTLDNKLIKHTQTIKILIIKANL